MYQQLSFSNISSLKNASKHRSIDTFPVLAGIGSCKMENTLYVVDVYHKPLLSAASHINDIKPYRVTLQALQTAPELSLKVVYDDTIIPRPPSTPLLLACKLRWHPLEGRLLLRVMFHRRFCYDSIQVLMNSIQ